MFKKCHASSASVFRLHNFLCFPLMVVSSVGKLIGGGFQHCNKHIKNTISGIVICVTKWCQNFPSQEKSFRFSSKHSPQMEIFPGFFFSTAERLFWCNEIYFFSQMFLKQKKITPFICISPKANRNNLKCFSFRNETVFLPFGWNDMISKRKKFDPRHEQKISFCVSRLTSSSFSILVFS